MACLSSRILSLSLTLAVPGIALSIGGCDRQSEPPAQPAADTPGKQGAASAVDRSHAGSAMPDFTLADPAGRKLRLPQGKALQGKAAHMTGAALYVFCKHGQLKLLFLNKGKTMGKKGWKRHGSLAEFVIAPAKIAKAGS